MTEKSYGGSAPFRKQGNSVKNNSDSLPTENKSKSKDFDEEFIEIEFDKGKVLKAGKIASEVRAYARDLVKRDMLLVEIAEKIESKIEELGGKPAFPTNLSINDIAAHYTPSHNDETKAYGLLKVDFGVHVDGWIADNAFSVDLEDNEDNRKLIKASEEALANALKVAKDGILLSEIGKEVQKTMESQGATPIINLSGHAISFYDLHAGATVPNYDSKTKDIMEEGSYAIEPFATFGSGKVYDGKPSGIYELVSDRNVRSPIARKILDFITEEYSTLPFCSRWIVKKFGAGALFGLKQLEDNGNLYQFSQLVESSHSNVAQTEHTILVEENKVVITTK